MCTSFHVIRRFAKPRRPSGRSVQPRSARDRSPIVARRWATGSRRTVNRSVTSPTTSPVSAFRSQISNRTGSRASGSHTAPLLIHDCQYTDDEYANHIGWGHSPVSDTLDFAHRSDVDRVVLFHHDPLHSDEFLDALVEDVDARIAELGRPPGWAQFAIERQELTDPVLGPAT